MHYLVTGGAGYIGSIAVKQLIRLGHQVTIFDNFSTGHRRLVNPQAVLYEGSLLEYQHIATALQTRPQAVLHFAAFSQVGESVADPQKYFQNNLIGALNLLEAMREYQVDKLIFSSTAAIFGEPATIPITEETIKSPKNPYGLSKLMIEHILAEYDRAYGLKSVCLRYFNACGADSDGEYGELHNPETHLIPLVLKTALGQRPTIKIFGTDYPTPDGTAVRDYIHVEDLIAAHILALQYLENKHPSTAFNLGNGTGYSVREIIEECRRVTGRPIAVEEVARRAGDPATLIASSAKIKNELGWQPRKNLTQIITDAWRWEQTANSMV